MAVSESSSHVTMSCPRDTFAIQLQTIDRKQLPSIESEQQRYFVGEAGEEFLVVVHVASHSKSSYQVSYQMALTVMQLQPNPPTVTPGLMDTAQMMLSCVPCMLLVSALASQLELKVDGQSTGYSKIIRHAHDSYVTVFEGWLAQSSE